jgi:hypothetical protein
MIIFDSSLRILQFLSNLEAYGVMFGLQFLRPTMSTFDARPKTQVMEWWCKETHPPTPIPPTQPVILR